MVCLSEIEWPLASIQFPATDAEFHSVPMGEGSSSGNLYSPRIGYTVMTPGDRNATTWQVGEMIVFMTFFSFLG